MNLKNSINKTHTPHHKKRKLSPKTIPVLAFSPHSSRPQLSFTATGKWRNRSSPKQASTSGGHVPTSQCISNHVESIFLVTDRGRPRCRDIHEQLASDSTGHKRHFNPLEMLGPFAFDVYWILWNMNGELFRGPKPKVSATGEAVVECEKNAQSFLWMVNRLSLT